MQINRSAASKSFSWRIVAGALLVLCGIAVLGIYVADRISRRAALDSLQQDFAASTAASVELLLADVERLASDIRFISSTPPVQGIVRAAGNNGYDEREHSSLDLWQRRLESIFTSYLETHPNARQVRYIGVADDGMELVRVERRANRIAAVSGASLQPQGDRDYFAATLDTPGDDIYLSPINLNREHGQVEVPHRPTLRVAIAVRAPGGVPFGLVVINEDVAADLAEFQDAAPPGSRAYLANSSGDFLVHPDPTKTFGFDLGQRYRWQDEFVTERPDGAGAGTDGDLRTYLAGDARVHAVSHEISYGKSAAPVALTLSLVADDRIVRADVVRARELVLLALLLLAAAGALFFYLVARGLARREEAGLKQAELAAIVSGSDDAIIGMSLDGVATSWNRAAEKMFGFTSSEALGKEVAMLLLPEDRKAEDVIIRSKVARGESVNAYDSLRRHKDGSVLATSVSVSPVRGADGQVIGAAKFVRDISERKAAEARVIEWNESLERIVYERTHQLEEAGILQQAILAGAGYAIIAAGTDGIITLFNPAAEAMLGFSAEEIINKSTAAAFLDRNEVARRAEALTRELGVDIMPGLDAVIAKARLQIPDEDEWTWIRKDGTRFPVLLNLSALLNSAGEISGFLGIAIDRTARKNEERELLRAKEAADAANKAKGTFLANMSHEIRTPMNAVLGMIQLLQRTTLTDRQADYLARARSAARSLLEIINDILDISKIEAGKLNLESQPFDINTLLRELTTILGVTAGAKEIEVLFRVDPRVPRIVEGDALRLKQVLVNLAGNAVKFTEQGEVVVTIHVEEERDEDIVLSFRVADSGIGITSEQQERIFEAFTQAEAGTTRRYGGTGLGLVISQRLIGMMGGELDLKSEPGVGSVFSFTVPLRMSDSSRNMQDTVIAAARFPDLRELRVLIVDDNAKAREVVAELVSSLGWEAELCATGDAAVRRAEAARDDGDFDVALIDWQMPGTDGWQTAGKLRAMAGSDGIPVVMMAKSHEREDLAEKAELDAERLRGVLIKPFAPSELLDAVACALDGSPLHECKRDDPVHVQRLVGMRVLVVEDNPTNQTIARELLSAEGAVVEVAGGGLLALDMLSAAGDRCDAVLMDIQMPELDGYETTRRIRGQLGLHELPIIAMTANTMQSDRDAALDAGMNEHIGKPFELDHLVATLLERTAREATNVVVAAQDTEVADIGTDGFDVPSALKRLGNNATLYAGEAGRFASQFGDAHTEIGGLLERGDHAGAAYRLHALRGVAATLGAVALAKYAGNLETAVKTARADGDFEDAAAQLGKLIEVASGTLLRVAGQLDTGTPRDTAAAGEAADLAPMLARLESLLHDGNMRATSVYAELRPRLADMPDEAVAALDTTIGALDFAGALRELRDFKAGCRTAPRSAAAR